MDIRTQKRRDEDNDVVISNTTVISKPVVMDYSNQYKNNQYATVGLLEVTVEEESGIEYIQSSGITNDNILVTDKLDIRSNPLFYQYQPKFDCLYPDNIKVYDEDNKLINYVLEYGYFGGEASNLNYNTEALYDSLDLYTLHGILDVASVTYNTLSTYPDLPFPVYGSAIFNGSIHYDADLISGLDANIMSVYFLVRDIGASGTFDQYDFLSTDQGGFSIVGVSGVYEFEAQMNTSGTVPLAGDTWYRLDYQYDNTLETSHIELHNLDTMTTDTMDLTGSMFKDSGDLSLVSTYSVMFDLGFFKDTLPAMDEPLFIHRYSKSITWDSIKPTGVSSYRVRLLLEDDSAATMVYDGVNYNNDLIMGRREEINHRLVYKKYDNSGSSSDWTWDESGNRIILREMLADTLTPGDVLYIYPVVENQMSIYYDEYDNSIHAIAGYFRADDYDGITIKEYYEIMEYEEMPFASDNQTIFKPYYIKVVKERAALRDPYTIQIGRFFIYEGEYPTYEISNSYEVNKYFDANNVLQENKVEEFLTYITTRGINIYKNGTLMDNSEIVDYNMYDGYIKFRSKFYADDKIEVTYLKKTPDYVLKYPILSNLVPTTDGGLGSYTAFRVYIRPHYDNYDIINPGDLQVEKICFKYLDAGQPVGDYISCYSKNPDGSMRNFNTTIIERHADTIIPLADVSLITDKTWEDSRVRGGGIDESVELPNFSKWPAFMDIGYGVDGKIIYQSIILIRIATTVLDSMVANYFYNDEEGAILYIKNTIERFIGSGVFYAIIDQNNKLWKDPYPTSVKKR